MRPAAGKIFSMPASWCHPSHDEWLGLACTKSPLLCVLDQRGIYMLHNLRLLVTTRLSLIRKFYIYEHIRILCQFYVLRINPRKSILLCEGGTARTSPVMIRSLFLAHHIFLHSMCQVCSVLCCEAGQAGDYRFLFSLSTFLDFIYLPKLNLFLWGPDIKFSTAESFG